MSYFPITMNILVHECQNNVLMLNPTAQLCSEHSYCKIQSILSLCLCARFSNFIIPHLVSTRPSLCRLLNTLLKEKINNILITNEVRCCFLFALLFNDCYMSSILSSGSLFILMWLFNKQLLQTISYSQSGVCHMFWTCGLRIITK